MKKTTKLKTSMNFFARIYKGIATQSQIQEWEIQAQNPELECLKFNEIQLERMEKNLSELLRKEPDKETRSKVQHQLILIHSKCLDILKLKNERSTNTYAQEVEKK